MVCGVGDVCVCVCVCVWVGVCGCGVGKLRVSKPVHCVDPDPQWRREVKTSTPAPLRGYVSQGPWRPRMLADGLFLREGKP